MADLLFASFPWVLTALVTLLLVPFERWFPKLERSGAAKGRRRAIALIAIAAIGTSMLMSLYLNGPLIQLMLYGKFMYMAFWPVPDWTLSIISLLVLDALYYLAHWLMHRVPMLWPLHSIHHSDKHVTALSGLLHHPLEVVFTSLFILFFAVVIGIPVVMLIIYGGLVALHSALSHADIRIPVGLDNLLRLVFVTPDVHRTHHSRRKEEGNSNFGALLTIWDRLFGTYTSQPKNGATKLATGLPDGVGPAAFTPAELIVHPLKPQRRQK